MWPIGFIYRLQRGKWKASVWGPLNLCSLSVRENRIDWVCGVQEGYRGTTIKVFLSEAVGSRMAECVLWYWLHKRQIEFFSRTCLQTTYVGETEWGILSIYTCFIIIISLVIFHSIYLFAQHKGTSSLTAYVDKRYSGDIHVNLLTSTVEPPHKQLSWLFLSLTLSLRRMINSWSLVRLSKILSSAFLKFELKCLSRSLNVSILHV